MALAPSRYQFWMQKIRVWICECSEYSARQCNPKMAYSLGNRFWLRSVYSNSFENCLAYMEPDRLQKRYRQKRSSSDSFEDHVSGRSKRAIPLIIYPEILVIVDYDGYRLHGGDNIQVSSITFASSFNQCKIRFQYSDQTVFCVVLEWCRPSLSLAERTKNSHQHCRHNHLTSKYTHKINPYTFMYSICFSASPFPSLIYYSSTTIVCAQMRSRCTCSNNSNST